MTYSHSPNLSEELKKQLEALVPAAFKDGQLDVNTLKQLLGMEVATHDERYGLNWAGKADSYKALQYPTSATLRPRQDQSVNFEHAQHVFIEGENLEVLKTLQRAYFGKVKMIYIDPPYNTGTDSFIYPDRFQESREDYLKRIESLDIDGNLTKEGLFRKNSRDNGHYHSNWLSMMLPRLYLARNLLHDDGVILVSIGDDEEANLKILMNEVFGEEHFLAKFTWKSRAKPTNAGGAIYRPQKVAEYVLIYGRKKLSETLFLPLQSSTIRSYPHATKDGRKYRTTTILTSNLGRYKRSTMRCTIGSFTPPIEQRWKAGDDEILSLYNKGYIDFRDGLPSLIHFEDEEKDTHDPLWTYLPEDWTETAEYGKTELSTLIGSGHGFDSVKPVPLIELFQRALIQSSQNAIVLDFFAGSGTTAHAVMNLNIEDAGNRQYICVQMPEPTNESSEAYKAGYKTIADISRERIRRVIAQIKQKADLANPFDGNDPNLGFRAFELAPSNFKQWRGDWAETTEELDKQLALMLPTEKQGAQSFDMAFELLLKNGRPLTSKLELRTVHETPVYIVWADEEGVKVATMMFVLESMQLEALPEILALKPAHIVFLDSVFQNNDSVKVNVALQCETAGVKFTSI